MWIICDMEINFSHRSSELTMLNVKMMVMSEMKYLGIDAIYSGD